MYTGLFHTHSGLRYIVLLALLIVIVKSIEGYANKRPFKKLDDKLSLVLLITTHLQLVFGFVLYFVSPLVQFNSTTMKDATSRYWAVEHLVGMLAAIVLITVARITSKRLSEPQAKHKRLAIFNTIALVIIIIIILHGGRKVF